MSTFLLVVLLISVSFSAGVAFAIVWNEWCKGDTRHYPDEQG